MATILVIDDDTLMIEVIQDVLELGAHHVIAATTPEQGIALAHDAHPALILCDNRLVKGNGFQILEAVQHLEIPFVFVTGSSDALTRLDAQESGATDFLSKPFKPEALIEIVNKNLHVGV